MDISVDRPAPLRPVPLPVEPGAGGAPRLPQPLTSFIGREQEVRDVRALLARDDVRLVTLTGPGGVGKTRLALRAVDGLDGFRDGVWFVSLAMIRDEALVLPAIATALGLRQRADRGPGEGLRAFLGSRRALLVLDNLEQVMAAGPGLTKLLTDCPGLTIVATSRFPLRLSGEYRFAVPPLAIDAGERDQPAEAVQLFVTRASAAGAGFSLTPENIGVLTAICHRLDGLPLAIELAAARSAALTPPKLLQTLERRLPMLIGGPWDAPDRQQTMRATIDWTYGLLDEREQASVRRLALFTGGFTLDAATYLLGHDALDDVIWLLEKHLLKHVAGADDRFTMLETIREYGLEMLAASGETAAIRARHAACFLALAKAAEFCFFMPLEDALPLIGRLEADHANLRAAHDWFVQTGDTASELGLAGALGALWVILGHSREGRVWLERALERDPPGETLARARALTTLSWVTRRLGDIPAAAEHGANGLALSRALSDTPGTVHALLLSGVAACHAGDFNRDTALAREALRILDDPNEHASWARFAASVALEQLAENALHRGDIAEATSLCQAALDRQRALGYQPGTSHLYASHAVTTLGDLARARHDQDVAVQQYRTGLALACRHRDAGGIARGLCNIAATLAVAGEYPAAARLFGASEALHEITGQQFATAIFDRQRALGLPEPWQAAGQPFGTYQQLRAVLLATGVPPYPPIPEPALAEAWWAKGRTMPVEDAVALALDAEIAAARRADPIAALSLREREVLRHLVAGQSNRAIADTLYLSERTVESHVRHILAKLNVDSRTAAAALALREGVG